MRNHKRLYSPRNRRVFFCSIIMRNKKFFFLFILTFVFAVGISANETRSQDISSVYKKELPWVKANLPKQGVLHQREDGYVYVKVDDRYIDDLYLNFVPFGYEKPKSLVGAHISVINVQEWKDPQPVEEVGQVYTFTIKNFQIVHIDNLDFVAITVEAPDLIKLRKKYGLGPYSLRGCPEITFRAA